MRPQESIAHYRIVSKLGEGGMGEVWRATDTKLGRDVAIKLLPEAFAQDPDRMARFTREAQVLASLNHPNIAAIYGVEERALIMELAEGLTLADRIAQGPIPLNDALPVLHQLIDALEYAHEHNVIHRDLKPANIKVTPEGRVKVLDFGLAKAMTADFEPGNPASSPTLTMRSTVVGALMGTAAYMSPEQARGQNVDKRADIWAFGVVLYEMVTGRRLFEGPTISDTLAAVLTRQPDFETVPTRLRRLLRQCLQPDPRLRLRDIGDARALVEESEEYHPLAPTAHWSPAPWIAAVAVLGVGLLTAVGFLWRATRSPNRPMIRFNVELGPDAVLGDRVAAAISPDGTRLAYSVRSAGSSTVRLATRLLDQSKATVLAGTEGAEDPFFSPDSQWIGFFAEAKMKKISVHGGAAFTLCDAANPRGAAWGDDGNIIVNLELLGLSRVPEAGGAPQALSHPDKSGERTHRWPQILPGGNAVLFTASNQAIGLGYDDADLKALTVKTGQSKIVQRGGYFARYLPSGHFIYVHHGTVFGVPFDLSSLQMRGTPVPILDDIGGAGSGGSGRFDFSQTGTFVYVSGESSEAVSEMMWMDSSGKTQTYLAASAAQVNAPRLSPDGKRVVVSMHGDISVIDPVRGAPTRLTFSQKLNRYPVWTPDGQHIIFSSDSGGVAGFRLWSIRADGSGQPQPLSDVKEMLAPYSISPDGKLLACTQFGSRVGIRRLSLDNSDPDHPKAGQPEPFMPEAADTMDPAFSPDGHWLAYTSLETGSARVFVRPFPIGPSSGKWQISTTTTGRNPAWSRNGQELFFLAPAEHRIMVAGYTAKEGSFTPEKPRLWSETPIIIRNTSESFDVAPDGKRVVTFPDQAPRQQGPVHVTVLLNFFDQLRRKLPH
jgi:serine/threonine-protein kinase